MSVAEPQVPDLVARRPVGHSLEAPFYTSAEVFDLDIEAVFVGHWLFCAAEAELPEPGDYVTVDIGRHSVIVVRDDDEEVRAFHNVCRHRGARLLDEACGSVGNIVCPYHQWTYRPDGELVFAESQAPRFDKSQFGLRPVHVRVIAGLVFICLADEPPQDLDEVASYLEPFLQPFDLAHTKVAHQIDLVEGGNWKLVMENNRECHHCDGAHPELVSAYFPLFGYTEEDITPRLRSVFDRYRAAQEALEAARRRIGFPAGDRRDLERPTGFQLSHLPLDGHGASFGVDGASVCRRLLGSITDASFGDLSLHLQPNSWFHFLGDHAIVFRVTPVTATETLVRSTWLVHADAVEGVDYDVDTLTGVWRATNEQDRELVERTQRGVASGGYGPGPYSMVEDDVEAFVAWYVARLAERVLS